MGGRGGVFSVITGLIWYGIWVVIGLRGVSRRLGSSGARSCALLLPLGALAVCLYWQVMPILSASMGSSLDMRKLMVYPVPHGEVVSGGGAAAADHRGRDADGADGERGGPVPQSGQRGMAGAARGADLHRVQSAAGQRHAQSVGAAAFQTQGSRVSGLRDFHGVDGCRDSCSRAGTGPTWHGGWVHADAECGVAVDGGRVGGAGALRIPGAAFTGGAGRCWRAWFGRTQFERNLRFDAVAAQATPQTNGVSTMQAAAEAFYRFPARWLRDPMAAIVEKELRSLARTPRYRMVFVMGFSFGLMVWLPMILGDRARPPPRVVASFPDCGLRICADAARSGLVLELFRLRPFGSADLFRRAAAAGRDIRGEERGGAGVHLPGSGHPGGRHHASSE